MTTARAPAPTLAELAERAVRTTAIQFLPHVVAGLTTRAGASGTMHGPASAQSSGGGLLGSSPPSGNASARCKAAVQ